MFLLGSGTGLITEGDIFWLNAGVFSGGIEAGTDSADSSRVLMCLIASNDALDSITLSSIVGIRTSSRSLLVTDFFEVLMLAGNLKRGFDLFNTASINRPKLSNVASHAISP